MQPNGSLCPHLSKLHLADSTDGATKLEVELLIGADYYVELTTGEVCRGEGGPVAFNPRLGWVLTGIVPTSNGQSPY